MVSFPGLDPARTCSVINLRSVKSLLILILSFTQEHEVERQPTRRHSLRESKYGLRVQEKVTGKIQYVHNFIIDSRKLN